jgi:hypothetical protein
MGNQQERLVSQVRLAMLLDCEGWISIRVLQRSKVRPFDMVPIVGMNNTSRAMVDWAASALESLEVPRYVWWGKASGFGKLPTGRVLVEGYRRVTKILPLIRPYLIIKGAQADLVSEFIALREERWKNAPGSRSYSDRELELANAVRDLNTKGYGWRPVSSTSLREGSVIQLRKKLGRIVMNSELPTKAGEAAETTARLDPRV